MIDDATPSIAPTKFFDKGYEVSANPDGNAAPEGVSQDPADYDWADEEVDDANED